MNIGQAVRELRQRRYPDLRQEAFAKCVGISQTYLSQLENGHKQASTEVLQSIADFCEVPLAILFWFTIEEKEVRKNKKEAFKLLKPCIDELINQLIL
jgi:transcriptional regulator with XRE-family HTH domain